MKRFLYRGLIFLLIVAGSWLVALGLGYVPLGREVIGLADNAFYDGFYRLRPVDDRTNGPVVIVTADDQSLAHVDKALHYGWPWPREIWGDIATYLDKCGAKAVAFDLIFDQTSVYQASSGDDDTFASAIGALKTPVVFGSLVNSDGTWDHFAPPVTRPSFGAVNVGKDVMYRKYLPQVFGQPALAVAAVKASQSPVKLPMDAPFLLHYYGPNKTPDGKTTFHFFPASSVLLGALQGDAAAKQQGITPDMFRGKIVLIGTTTAGTYDLKSSPLSAEYPGVEVQATAIENLLDGQSVQPIAENLQNLAALLAAALTAGAIVFFRPALAKILGPIVAVGAILTVGAHLFTQPDIRWLAPTQPLLACAVATVAAFAWTYFAEDRQRKFMLKALSKVVSPAVAEQLSRDPQRLSLGTVRARVTLMFTDLADFTAMSEKIDVQKLGELLNKYLGEMSDQVLLHQGTLDKYIGDAIMCFWNAPLPQADHAARACRAALAIVAREAEIKEEMRQLGATKIFTRLGINTTDAAVGFTGSSHLFNYTALGDGVNLASRLEGANKLYGSRILLAESTANLVREQFILCKLDVLRVKGKREPMAVYELLGEKGCDGGEKLEMFARRYESALGNYQNRHWNAAEQELLELQDRFAENGPIKALLKRIESLREHPPVDDWDGVYEAKEK